MKRKYYCRNCFHFLINPNVLNKIIGECYGQKRRTVAGKDKACKHYRPKTHNSNL